MRAHRILAPVILAGLTVGCGGGSPSAPSTATPPTRLSPALAQGIIGAALTQATGVLSTSPDGVSSVITCPDGGSLAVSIDAATPAGPSGTVTMSSRIEFRDCRSQTVTINGDPYLSMTGEDVFVRGADGTLSSVTATMHRTGGLRFDAPGTQGRARYDCTDVMSFQFVNGIPSQPTFTSTGTITWEQPLGTVTVLRCGA